jgi:hypothetical protein
MAKNASKFLLSNLITISAFRAVSQELAKKREYPQEKCLRILV